jgi:hypothetical protein
MPSAPTGYPAVAPWIATKDTGALLDFITAAFDGVELGRVPLADGRCYACSCPTRCSGPSCAPAPARWQR